jgi:hypothetical protein
MANAELAFQWSVFGCMFLAVGTCNLLKAIQVPYS